MMFSETVIVLLLANFLDLLHMMNAGGQVNPVNDDLTNKDQKKAANGEVESEQVPPRSLEEHNGESSFSASFEYGEPDLEELIQNLDDEENVVLIWKIENDQKRLTDLRDYKLLRSSETYVVFNMRRDHVLMQNIKVGKVSMNSDDMEVGEGELVSFSNVYYWIGKQSTLADAKAAASEAVIIDKSVHKKVRVHRVVEGNESPSFRTVFEQNEKASRSPITFPPTVDENTKMMFLVRDDYMARFTKVNTSLKQFIHEENTCLVLNSGVVYTYCGHSASGGLKKLAEYVARKLLRVRGPQVKEIVIHRREDEETSKLTSEENQMLDQFYAEFTPVSESEETFDRKLRLSEGRTKMESQKTEEDLSITRFFERSVETASQEQIDSKSITISSFRANDCFVIEMGRNVGILVWIGRHSAEGVREKAAEYVESLLEKKGYSRTTPVLYADERNVNIPPSIYLNEFITLMENVDLPISWVLMPDEESIALNTEEDVNKTEDSHHH